MFNQCKCEKKTIVRTTRYAMKTRIDPKTKYVYLYGNKHKISKLLVKSNKPKNISNCMLKLAARPSC